MNTYNTQLTTKNNLRSLLALSIIFLFGSIFTVQAQSADGSDNVAQGDAAGVSIKLIDNKGTIKYLQSNNGITTVTSTEADNKTTTTWQLGGALLEDTYIDVDGNAFALDGLKLETGAASPSSTEAPDQSNHGDVGATGWTLVVRDEATGEFRKLLATDLVSGIRFEHTQLADAAANVEITVTGLPALTASSTIAKLFVYRNGAKLRSGTDFTAAADKVTITYSATDIPMYTGDVIEIQYIK